MTDNTESIQPMSERAAVDVLKALKEIADGHPGDPAGQQEAFSGVLRDGVRRDAPWAAEIADQVRQRS
ncbi:hypothetical protein [Streptomyces prunicolor]